MLNDNHKKVLFRNKSKTKYILFTRSKNNLEFVTFPVKVMARALIQRCRVARAHARSVDDRMQGILWW